MRDDHAEGDAPQGALFAPESPASPPRPGPTPDPFAAPVRPSPEAAAAPEAEFAPSAARRRAAPLSGPTLDDVMSRVWEGLRAEVPTPCPVCHTEIESSMHGRCGACGSALD